MAIFSFPVNPLVGQTYTAPNSVVYTWDGEKWVGSGGAASSGSGLVADPAAGTEQAIVPGQVGDSPLTLRGLNGQAAHLLDVQDYLGNTIAGFDNAGWLGVGGVADPSAALDVAGDIKLTGGLSANGSFGTPGQHLVTDGVVAYWEDSFAGGIDGILASGATTSRDLTVGGMTVDGDLTVNGTMTTIDTEVIRLADNIITLNSNYTGNTPNENAGIEVNRGSLQPKRLYWDEISDVWTTGTDTFEAGLFEGNLVGNVSGTVSSIANHTTDGLAEGLNNLYFTQDRARGALTATGNLSYNSATGVLNYDESVSTVNGFTGDIVLTADDIPETVTNQYLNTTSWDSYIGGTSLNDLADVDVSAAVNGDILYWNAVSGQWQTIAGDFFDDFVVLADFDVATGILTHTRTDGNVMPVSLDGRYLQLSGGTLTGPLYGTEATFANVAVTSTLTSYAVEVTDNLHVAGNAQVDSVLTAANASITDTLTANQATITTADVVGNLTANTSTFANTTVTDTLTANAFNADTITANNGVFNQDLTANTATFANAAVTDTLTANQLNANNATVAGDLTSNTATFANANVTDTLSAETAVVNGGLTANTIAGANVSVSDTLTAANASIAYATVTGDLHVGGALTAANVDISINELNNVDAAGAANGDILYWNATGNGGLGAWEQTAGNAFDTYVNAAAFDDTTGDITLTRNDGNTVVTSLDGRYGQAVNGVVPDATGNIVLNIATTTTGDVASRPATANTGELYIVSGDADANNDGETYIYVAGAWQRIVSFDQAESDARYINTAGDAMTGALTLAADPTVALGAVTKQYVDALAANTASISAFAFNSNTDGNLVITDLIGTQWGVDLDGRYLELAGGTVTGPVTFQGDVTANAVTAANVDVTDTLTADTAAINGNLTANTSTFSNTTVTDTLTADTAVVNGGLTANTISAANVDVADTLSAETAVVNGDLSANTSTFANTNVTDTLTADTAVVNGGLTANTISAANVDVTDTLTADTAVVNGGLTANTITAANVDVTDTLTAANGVFADATVTGNLHIGGTLTAANVDISLGEMNDVDTTGAANGDILYWDATASEWTTIAGDFGDDYVNAVAFSTANGDLTLTRTDGNTMVHNLDGRYLELAGGTLTGPVTFQGDVTANVISAANVSVSDTLTADTAAINGNLTANTSTFANTTVTDTLTADTAVVNGGLTANTISAANVDVTDTLTADTAVVNGGLTANTITGANVTVTDTLTANVVTTSGDVNIGGTLTAANVDIALDELSDINVGAAANGQVLYYNSTAGEWQPKEDIAVASAAFQSTTGNVTITMTDTSTHVFSIDGRYPETVNGIVPDVAGNIAVSLTATSTGDFVSRPGNTTDGMLYVVSGDANTSLNGDTYIYVGNTTVGTWEEIAPSDVAGNDARYVNVSGDTMGGQFTLDAGQTFTSDDDAASVGYVKDYVANVSLDTFSDANTAGAANGDIMYWDQTEGAWKAIAGDSFNTYVNAATFSIANGDLTHTLNDGNTVTINLDGRYATAADGTAAGQVLTWNGTSWVATAPASAQFDFQTGAGVPTVTNKADGSTALTEGDFFWDTTNNKLYAWDAGGSAWVAVDTDEDTTVASIAFNNTDGNLVITDSAAATFDTNLDGRYVAAADGTATGQVLTWNGTAWVASALAAAQFDFQTGAGQPGTFNKADGVTPLSEGDQYWDTTNNKLYAWDAALFTWEPIAADQFDFQQGAAAPVTTTRADGITPLSEGDQFWDATNNLLYSYDAGTAAWVAVGAPQFDNYVASATVNVSNTAFTVDYVYANTSVANTVTDLAHGITNHTDVDTVTAAPTAGQVLAWDAVGANWIPSDVAAGATISDTAPASPSDGDLWYDSLTNFRTFIWSATAAAWLDVAPSGSGGSTAIAMNDLTDADTTSTPPVANSSLLGWNGTNWVPVVSLDASSGAANDF